MTRYIFGADNGTTGHELWRSTGTAAGTVMVKDFKPSLGGLDFEPFVTSMNGVVYLAADDGTNGNELWKIADAPNGIQPMNLLSVCNVYPNPLSSSSDLTIELPENTEPIRFTLHDLLGKEINSFVLQENERVIHGNNLPSGSFFYTITSANGMIGRGKLIIE